MAGWDALPWLKRLRWMRFCRWRFLGAEILLMARTAWTMDCRLRIRFMRLPLGAIPAGFRRRGWSCCEVMGWLDLTGLPQGRGRTRNFRLWESRWWLRVSMERAGRLRLPDLLRRRTI